MAGHATMVTVADQQAVNVLAGYFWVWPRRLPVGESLTAQVTSLHQGLAALFHAIDDKPGDDLGSRALADALIYLRELYTKGTQS